MSSCRITKPGDHLTDHFPRRCSCNPLMMRQFRKLLGWRQKKPRKNGVSPETNNRRSVSLGSIRKASTISMAISSLGFSVQLSQSESQLSDHKPHDCYPIDHSNDDSEGTTHKTATPSGGASGTSGHAKKRSTTSSPPDETAAGVPPRLPENADTDFRMPRSLTIDVMPRVDEAQEEVESVFMRDYDDEMDALQAQLRGEDMPPRTPRSVMMEDVRYDREDSLLSGPSTFVKDIPQRALGDVRPVPQTDATADASRPTDRTSEATLLTLPPELILEVSKYLPFCSHTALYDTCSRLNHVIRDNNNSYYEREIAKAGSNPRGDSLLTRSIFAFQYLNRPSFAPEAHSEFNIQSSFGYIRYLKLQSQCVKDIADLLQSDVYMKFLLSDEGRKQLRLTAHGSHEPEDLCLRDDVDRDLMHLWEFINYSIDKLVRTEVPMYYPHADQKLYYDATRPFPLLSPAHDVTADELKKLVTRIGKDGQFPHDQFLVWERRRLRDLRNEYWKEDTDNLSKVESKDMRWILEVVKAVFIGVVFKPLIEGPREKNKAIMELKAKALRKASKNGTPAAAAAANTPIDPPSASASVDASSSNPSSEERRNEWLLSTQDWPGASSTAADAVDPSISMSESWQTPPYSQTYTEQEVRAYVAYLVATGGMKLLLLLIRAATECDGVLTPSRLDEALAVWDRMRGNGEVPAEYTQGFDADRARGKERARNPDKEEFEHLWKPTRIERIWERDCKRGGWSNWEGWVAEYYLIA
ncbi:hypothetical protein DRE_06690 [Drechslerella stenobrocha 248]|uniref:F-box domain-containing protein n=1 Tax=Drechslerella stenobrocha 248 TaxID=1043628 RepID=W7HX97_9PEZI|nr:hypothetical protein DRE_06690 [Drechslerella stenobrocha 248]